MSFPGLLQQMTEKLELKTTEIYSFTVLEARSQKSKSWQGPIPSGRSREDFFLLSGSFWWLLAASLQSQPLS
jgi:hypothetical protein